MPRPRAQLDTSALAAAFAPDGLHGTPIERVVAAAGVAKPTLYAHFRSKGELVAAVKAAEDSLGGTGRVLLRPSGTEPLVRVMVEAAEPERARMIADDLALVVRERLGLEQPVV